MNMKMILKIMTKKYIWISSDLNINEYRMLFVFGLSIVENFILLKIIKLEFNMGKKKYNRWNLWIR